MQLSNKGLFYNSFKQDIEYDKYLNILSRSYRQTFFRTSNHRLPVETGRYDGTAYEDRSCPLCNMGSISNEQHYLLNCEYFRNSRDKYIRNYNFSNNVHSSIDFMCTRHESKLVNLCRLIRVILSKF